MTRVEILRFYAKALQQRLYKFEHAIDELEQLSGSSGGCQLECDALDAAVLLKQDVCDVVDIAAAAKAECLNQQA